MYASGSANAIRMVCTCDGLRGRDALSSAEHGSNPGASDRCAYAAAPTKPCDAHTEPVLREAGSSQTGAVSWYRKRAGACSASAVCNRLHRAHRWLVDQINGTPK